MKVKINKLIDVIVDRLIQLLVVVIALTLGFNGINNREIVILPMSEMAGWIMVIIAVIFLTSSIVIEIRRLYAKTFNNNTRKE